MELPFELGSVEKKDYYPFTLLLISILLIGYGSAHIQAFRTRGLIQKYIDKKTNYVDDNDINIKDVVDCSISSTFNRVGPIAQVILGKSQFINSEPISTKKGYLSAFLYIVLKISLIFYYISDTDVWPV